jgi:hypothetical protein
MAFSFTTEIKSNIALKKELEILDTKIKVFRNILVGFLVSSVARMDGHMFT